MDAVYVSRVALALTGQDSQAHDALERYLNLLDDDAPKTIAALKRLSARYVNEHTDPRYVEYYDRLFEGLRKAGMQEGWGRGAAKP